jgi:hypothetical protein
MHIVLAFGVGDLGYSVGNELTRGSSTEANSPAATCALSHASCSGVSVIDIDPLIP